MRIGTGFDVHRLVPQRPLVLGGVRIPHPLGLEGHSDADVLLHAVADALLGAAALGDLGRHFPPDDPAFKDADSAVLLRRVVDLLAGAGWRTVNVDSTIIAQRPRLAAHIPTMCANLAQALKIGEAQVSVKATTTEGLGFTGNEEGIAAQAVALIESADGG
ncbi:MAG: 2-C-methyl-D-erythritol 2,4-cyclodiphosphate synthase [SAR324 cluster bacterium]|nr:2-C-methyl-D-erythritol 2,4-cyclodiphosphate synthase [SAR324 cluster bacterium]MCZ6556295.1 2-C-methyl-D-erythritol 2,4-cyclodiphosphate synthase [SAR324 cluster bacterium]MCZ6627414.1 2-C-methyl-D-erythritol 2,4-cyclodiphosphate synthase [SAR324 cluster bacterium]MCZ6646518.1 2-C-methyl-D-erythritol 2,4-cyclodiphosphate synthase [SAR324 cluster bacterium]MCZ6728693.1 2-C-methyl-D-erythritol 2,4-cyclodiphosphate synthase [SAR324 cluster bacterium]